MAPPTPTAVLALASTLHLAMLLLLRHRSGGRTSLLLLPSATLACLPWVLPAPLFLLSGFVAHLGWLTLVRLLSPPSTALRSTARPQAPRGSGAFRPEVTTGRLKLPKPKPKTPDFLSLPILAVLDETPEIRTFRLARPEGFDFEAGQFLMVRVVVDGKPLVRCYSISSAPGARGYLEVSVRRQGVVSRILHATARPGAFLNVKGPAGAFTYPGNDERPLALVAGGVGITPLISMLRHALSCDPTRQVTLFLSARTLADLPFREELALLSARHPQLESVLHLTAESREGYGHGRIDGKVIAGHVPDPSHTLFLLCGPGGMIAGVSRDLEAMGVPKAQVRSEAFEAANAVAEAQAERRQHASSGTGLSVRKVRGGIPIQLDRTGRTVHATSGQTILDACDSAGVDLPSLCRAGSCGTCRTRVVSGKVDGSSEALSPEDRQSGFVLACVSVPLTPLRLEA